MYVPDRTFMKRLRELDPRLGCEYRPVLGNFVITYQRAIGTPANVMVVKRDDGGFRQPDNRDLNRLHEGDLKRESIRTKLDKANRYMIETREKDRKKSKELFRDLTKDNKIQLVNTFAKAAGASKANSTFRRINVKPKGKVFGRVSKNT